MSERPEPDKTVDKTVEKPPVTTPVTGTKPEEHPTTAEKPGTGKPETPEKKDKWHPGWSGEDKYPDGYTMARQPNGQITLTNPGYEQAIWNQQAGGWVDGVGSPMPEGWSNGHFPDTQVDGPHSH